MMERQDMVISGITVVNAILATQAVALFGKWTGFFDVSWWWVMAPTIFFVVNFWIVGMMRNAQSQDQIELLQQIDDKLDHIHEFNRIESKLLEKLVENTARKKVHTKVKQQITEAQKGTMK